MNALGKTGMRTPASKKKAKEEKKAAEEKGDGEADEPESPVC